MKSNFFKRSELPTRDNLNSVRKIQSYSRLLICVIVIRGYYSAGRLNRHACLYWVVNSNDFSNL